jgi:DNA-binding SARP family transcriptional activator
MRFRVLGPLEVWDGPRRVPVGGPQQRALLALLLLDANRVVPVDLLVADLWGERPPATARGLLQGCVAQLRRALPAGAAGPPLVTRPPGYLLRVEPGELDLDRFEELVATAGKTAAAGSPSALGDAAAQLSEALELWRGPPLGDIDVRTLDTCWLIRGMLVDAPVDTLATLAARDDVSYVSPAQTGTPPPADGDPGNDEFSGRWPSATG